MHRARQEDGMKATVEIVVGGRNLTFAETRRSKSSRREFSDPSNSCDEWSREVEKIERKKEKTGLNSHFTSLLCSEFCAYTRTLAFTYMSTFRIQKKNYKEKKNAFIKIVFLLM